MATCRDIEGWQLVSRLRDFDTTPCFEEGFLISGLLAAALLIAVSKSLALYNTDPSARSRKSTWILRAKLAFLTISFGSSLVNVVLVAYLHKPVPVLQSYIVEPLTLAAVVVFTYFNHTRTRSASALLLVFWPLYICAVAVWTRTVILKGLHSFVVILSLKLMTAGAGAISYALECFGPEVGLLPSDNLSKESPLLKANIYSIWTFSWMTPLMKKGASQYITVDDLPPLKSSDESANLGQDLKNAMERYTLWKALFVAYGRPYAFAAGLKVLQDLLAFLQPQLLRWLLSYISEYQNSRLQPNERPSKIEGFAIALIMFIASVVQTICLNQYFQRTFETGMRVRAGLVTAIYGKALVLSNDERTRATGDIVNLMSVDATRLQDLCTYGLIAISGPLQIILAFISLYSLLGWAAFVGVAIMIFSIPLNTLIARILKRMQEQQMKNRDKRTRLMSELLANIKSIKLYAWEYSFIRKIMDVRNNQELKMLRKIGVVTAANTALWSGIPLLVAFSSFATAAVTSSTTLTSDVIFPAISLFMLLQFPLAMFSQVTSNIIEAVVSVQRLSSFLGADELQRDSRKFIDRPMLQTGDEVLAIKDGDFSWSKKKTQLTLEGINLSVRKGELVGILGRVGAGKSSLLSAIIGDMICLDGEVVVCGSIAYAPQNPWILSATIRDNILFSHEYDEAFYNMVIEGCALHQDLMLMPNSDLTEVGEKGITLSGGQRARIALARAVYARADLVLLDDCLAAVDSHVAQHVFDHVIGPNGLLATKACILVTNSIAFIQHFDFLAFIHHGIILEHGSYQTLVLNSSSEVAKLVKSHGTKNSSGSSTPFTISGTATPLSKDDQEDVKSEDLSSLSKKLKQQASFQKARIASTLKTHASSSGPSTEHQEQGQVKTDVYMQYIQAASKTGFAFFLFATVFQQAASVFATLTLGYWGEHNQKIGSNSGIFKYLLLYGCFSLSSSLLGAISAITMWVYCALRSAKHLHDSMLESLIHAPLSFFELTPTGRILNLFSRDTYVVDQILARVIQGLIRTLAVCLSIIVVIGTSFPPFLIAVLPLGWFYLQVMKYYLATSRELKRIDAVTRSPIFIWFSESLSGLSTIRAFHQQEIFIAANQIHLDQNQICYLPSISVNPLLGISALITTGVDAGSVGLVLSYALNTTSSLNWVVRSASEVEQNIVSVERILHQTDIESEAPQEIPDMKPSHVWPVEEIIQLNIVMV
ncbi:unnamed protein product [Cyclocybe aegerita]|uniref:Metal resistance protein YCF1 n=1 Tax=Cyclocybe aegerita TaxID=1973307 RepID=A0A8S0XP22_CYCAE|nr:unnamed protein product [Cyclocybe aegerita]